MAYSKIGKNIIFIEIAKFYTNPQVMKAEIFSLQIQNYGTGFYKMNNQI